MTTRRRSALVTRLRKWVRTRTGKLVVHDASLFGSVLAALLLSSDHLDWSVLGATVITAVKMTLRQILPVPPKSQE